jgi:hypothetical protein
VFCVVIWYRRYRRSGSSVNNNGNAAISSVRDTHYAPFIEEHAPSPSHAIGDNANANASVANGITMVDIHLSHDPITNKNNNSASGSPLPADHPHHDAPGAPGGL